MFESKMIWFYIVLAVVGLGIAVWVFKKKEVSVEAKVWYKLWSTKLAAIGVVLAGAATMAPEAMHTAWDMLPPDLKAMIPPRFAQVLSYVFFVAAVLSKYIKQPKAQEALEKKLEKEVNNVEV